jgi:hypothetical protein
MRAIKIVGGFTADQNTANIANTAYIANTANTSNAGNVMTMQFRTLHKYPDTAAHRYTQN